MTGIGSRAQSKPVLAAAGVMPGNRCARNSRAERRRVQQHRGAAASRHLGGDPAGDDVARGELGVGVHVEHEPAAVGVEQHRALAAHRLGDEEVAGRRERRGVELVELQVGERRSGPQRGGDAVAGGDRGVRGVR